MASTPAESKGLSRSATIKLHYRIGGNRRQRSGLEIPIAVFAAPHNSGDNPMPTIRPYDGLMMARCSRPLCIAAAGTMLICAVLLVFTPSMLGTRSPRWRKLDMPVFSARFRPLDALQGVGAQHDFVPASPVRVADEFRNEEWQDQNADWRRDKQRKQHGYDAP
jgi:hypothetical protein